MGQLFICRIYCIHFRKAIHNSHCKCSEICEKCDAHRLKNIIFYNIFQMCESIVRDKICFRLLRLIDGYWMIANCQISRLFSYVQVSVLEIDRIICHSERYDRVLLIWSQYGSFITKPDGNDKSHHIHLCRLSGFLKTYPTE